MLIVINSGAKVIKMSLILGKIQQKVIWYLNKLSKCCCFMPLYWQGVRLFDIFPYDLNKYKKDSI